MHQHATDDHCDTYNDSNTVNMQYGGDLHNIRIFDTMTCSYRVDVRQSIVLRIIDTPFTILGATYTSTNKIFIDTDDSEYCFDDRGVLTAVPHDDRQSQDEMETMLCVDAFEELSFFQTEDIPRRLVGVTMLVGYGRSQETPYDIVVEIDQSLAKKEINGIARANTATNTEDYRFNHSSLPLAILAEGDILLYPDNILLTGLLPKNAEVGSGGILFAGNRCIAVYRL